MEKLTFTSRVQLRNGKAMPVIGYSSKEHEYNHKTQMEIFINAIELGYRYFDLDYNDDCTVPMRMAIERSGIPREDFFIACKYSNRFAGTVALQLNDMMDGFGGKYDMVSLSWPFSSSYVGAWNGITLPKEANGFPIGIQDLYEDGEIGVAGVCNFDIKHFEALQADERFKFLPFVDQNQFHPLYACPELRAYCKQNGIVFVKGFETNDALQAKKPPFADDVTVNGDLYETSERIHKANQLGLTMYSLSLDKYLEDRKPEVLTKKGDRTREITYFNPMNPEFNPRTETDFYASSMTIRKLAERYGVTNRQIIDRWALQHDAVVLVKGIMAEDMERGKALFDFELTQEDMSFLDGFNLDKRIGYHADYIDF